MTNTRPRGPQPGVIRRAGDPPIPHGSVPLDRTPRVPPNANSQPIIQRTPNPGSAGPQLSPPPGVPRSAAVEETTHVRPDTSVPLDNSFERVDLLSDFVFYPWRELSVRKVVPMDHAKITRAARSENMSVMLDALAATCTQDPRDLAVSDFYTLCQWHKVHSYPATTTVITWSSRYGDRVSAKVRRTSLELTRLGRTREEYLAWKARGLAVPTMRDVETLVTLSDPDVGIMFQRAQFIDPEPLAARIERLRAEGDSAPSVTARVERLNELGMAFYETIDQFADQFAEFGVTEYAEPVHPSFNPRRAIEALRASGLPDCLEEANEIECALRENRIPEPRKEKVPVSFDLWHIFPYV